MKIFALPIAVFVIIGSMLLPLPTFAIDMLLVGNLIFSFFLLAATLFVTEPLKLSSFPTIILLTALYRLSLNVSTTRSILGKGDGGKAIEAFGSLVIGENLVVGLVVFVIITIVQFLVVAKGAERVAEVSARFALDAMPGKQMAIDADIRSGLLGVEEAREKRQELQAESRFYGALDGAMKFVKGDAIAGMLITAVNIVGGIISGVLLQRMSMVQALSHYTVLTVGDGMLSQIPALLNSLAAGIIVTRVVRGDNLSVAAELPAQMAALKYGSAIALTSSFLLSFVLGLPALLFMLLPIGFIIQSAAKGNQDKKRAVARGPIVTFKATVPTPITIELPKNITAVGGEVSFRIRTVLDQIRQYAFDTYGLLITIPKIVVTERRTDISILYYGTPWATVPLGEDGVLCEGVLLERLHDLVRSHRHEFVNDSLTRRTLDFCEGEFGELAGSLVPTVIGITPLTQLLRDLVKEGISLRNFEVLFQAIAESVPKYGTGPLLLEEIRIALHRTIIAEHCSEGKAFLCITLDPRIDLQVTEAERMLATNDAELLLSIASAASEFAEIPLVVARGSRRRLKEVFELRGESRRVLAFEELPQLPLSIVHRISIEEVHFSSGRNVEKENFGSIRDGSVDVLLPSQLSSATTTNGSLEEVVPEYFI